MDDLEEAMSISIEREKERTKVGGEGEYITAWM